MRILPGIMTQLIEEYRGDKDRADEETLAPVLPSVAVVNNDAQQPAVLDEGPFLGLDGGFDDRFGLEDFVSEFWLGTGFGDVYAIGLGGSMPSL